MSRHLPSWMRAALGAALGFLLLAGVPPPQARAQFASSSPRKLDVPYEPTPHRVVEIMLRLAELNATDYLVDLGCGDGRIPVTAAERYGVKALCIDLDPARIKEAQTNARLAKVEDKVEIVEQDLFKTDISKADVLTLYLWPEVNLKLRERILALKPGTRVVSHEHSMGDWRPDATRRLGANIVYLWRVPARIAGNWRLSYGGQEIDLTLNQNYQVLTGRSAGSRGTNPVRDGRVAGREVSFTLILPNNRSRRYLGRLSDTGELQGADWKAVRRD